MRAPLFIAASLVFLISCGDAEQTVCDQAVQHVAACLSHDVETAAPVCTADAASQAEKALQMSCSQIANGERSSMFVQDLMCKLLPFVCQIVGGGSSSSGETRRINDCWNDPQHGWCVDVVKLGNGCTQPMDQQEWLPSQNPWTHAECREMRDGRCRLARVCFNNIPDAAQCNHIQHHNDQPMCENHNDGDPGHQGDLRRISDCWHDFNHGWCYDAIKLGNEPGVFSGGACSRLMEHHEWDPWQHGYSHAECLENHGGRCRVVRICRNDLADKAQCLNQTDHHHDLPMCPDNLP